MNSVQSRTRPIGALFSVLVTLYCLFSLAGSIGRERAGFFGVPPMGVTFGDTLQLSASVECDATLDQLLNEGTCDPFGRPFNYPPFAYYLAQALGMTSSTNGLFGAGLGIVLMVGTFGFFLSYIPARMTAITCASICLLSFPFQLAMERGNFDSLVLVLCMAVVGLDRQHGRGKLSGKIIQLASSLFTFVAVALKFFPFAGSLLWVLRSRRVQKQRIAPAVCGLLAIAIQAQDIPSILRNTPKPTGETSFGFLCYGDSAFGSSTMYLLLLIKILVGATSFFWTKRRLPPIEKNDTLFASADVAVFFGAIFVFSYAFSRSFDYRLGFLMGTVPLLLNGASIPRYGSFSKLFLGAVLFIGFEQYATSTPVGALFEAGSDFLVQPFLVGALLAFLALRALSAPIAPSSATGKDDGA